MKLSIIVPVYNVEQWLVRCLESIVLEMCDDYELILVDDGSTDTSGALCDDFAGSHPRHNIVVIHQENGGLSAARNRGIDASRGEYITFVDSDDYIDFGTIAENMDFLLAHPEVDMLEYPVEVHAESDEAYMLTFPDETQRTAVFADWIRREGYAHCYACNKVYVARIWAGLRFPVGVHFEDVALMPQIVHRCCCVHYSSRGCYRYVMHANSITTTYRYHKQLQLFEGNHRLYKEIKDMPTLSIEALRLWVHCLNRLIDMGRCADVDRVGYRHVVSDAERFHPSYKTLLDSVADWATRIKLLPLPILGLRTYCRLYVLFSKPLLS